ncbi:MAG: class I SAM-dependent methyltransferase [Rubrivivax sp.]
MSNADQIADWNGPLGQRWAALQREIEGIVRPFGLAALARAAPQAGERVVDIGCGCGDTSIALAQRVGASGRVLGVDVSRPMLDVARAAGGPSWLTYREADAAEAELPPDTDVLFSRFGVMFFDQPVPALRHLRGALRRGGRFVFACWRAPRDNHWAMTPVGAARQALGVTPAPADPHAPGPFAFADGERVRGLLADAGFEAIGLERCDAPVLLGASARAAAENSVRVGPTSRFVREQGAEHLPLIVDAIEAVLAPLAAPDGSVSLIGSTWIVAAHNP